MRIISGSAKGRKLISPPKTPGREKLKPIIRPTSDRSREALFNILGRRVIDATVLDLFAGTGALGLEALSRGASSALFVDSHRQAHQLIRKNIELCGVGERATIIKHDLLKSLHFLKELAPDSGFNVIFADPPYRKRIIPHLLEKLLKADLVHTKGLVIAEDASGESIPDHIGSLLLVDKRSYGENSFWVFKMKEEC